MFAWGLVTMAHALIKNRAGYLTGIYLVIHVSDLLPLIQTRYQCAVVRFLHGSCKTETC